MTISQNFPTARPSLLLDFSNQTVLDPRVTFTRTTTGYYYDNKSAALAEQNLLTYSNTFTNAAWTASNIGTPVVGATDPAGGATAYTLTASVGSAGHYMFGTALPIGAGTYTLSAYLQAGTNNFATIEVYNAAGTWVVATFNLTSGSVGFSQQSSSGSFFAYVGNSVTQVGSTNWYRCSLTFSNTGTFNVFAFVQLNNSATPTYGSSGLQIWTAAGTETLLVYGTQLEQRSSPTVYTATTAAAINTYTPTLQTALANAPRFDYDPVTRQSLGLLLEQASTNLALYSSDYTNAAWSKVAVTITPTADVSPDGTQNAQLMVLGATSTAHDIQQNTTYTAAAYTTSVYLKFYGQQFVQLYTSANGVIFCNFDIINGTAGTPSGSGSPVASIQNVGNGWYRCSLTFTASAVGALFAILASNSLTAGVTPAFAGNGFNGYLIWGAQVELAPSATSYIATVASAQTRTVDAPSMTGTNFTSWYNYSGGTIYVEAATANPSSSIIPALAVIGDGTSANFSGVYYTSVGVQIFNRVNGVTLQSPTIALPSAIAANTFYKTAFTYSITGTAISSAGQTATTSAIAVSAPASNQLMFPGTGSVNTNPLNGHIKKFAYYPTVLTSTQLQSLSAN